MFGADHNLTLRAALGVGANLLQLRKFAAAEKILRDCHDRSAKHTPWAKGLLADMKKNWIRALLQLEKRGRALQLLKELADGESGVHAKWARAMMKK